MAADWTQGYQRPTTADSYRAALLHAAAPWTLAPEAAAVGGGRARSSDLPWRQQDAAACITCSKSCGAGWGTPSATCRRGGGGCAFCRSHPCGRGCGPCGQNALCCGTCATGCGPGWRCAAGRRPPAARASAGTARPSAAARPPGCLPAAAGSSPACVGARRRGPRWPGSGWAHGCTCLARNGRPSWARSARRRRGRPWAAGCCRGCRKARPGTFSPARRRPGPRGARAAGPRPGPPRPRSRSRLRGSGLRGSGRRPAAAGCPSRRWGVAGPRGRAARIA